MSHATFKLEGKKPESERGDPISYSSDVCKSREKNCFSYLVTKPFQSRDIIWDLSDCGADSNKQRQLVGGMGINPTPLFENLFLPSKFNDILDECQKDFTSTQSVYFSLGLLKGRIKLITWNKCLIIPRLEIINTISRNKSIRWFPKESVGASQHQQHKEYQKAITPVWEVKENEFLLVANKNDVRLISVMSPKKNSSIILRSLSDAVIVDFFYEKQIIFWCDIQLEMIKSAKINLKDAWKGSNPKKVKNYVEQNVISEGLISPDGLACDWIGHKLYWSDSDTNRIEVANFDGSYRKLLFWTELSQPRAVVLVPSKRLMFWSDWGDSPKIERASMDGSPDSRSKIITKGIGWPNGLAADHSEERLYFIDARYKTIESVNYDGSDRKIILEGQVTHPFALTVYGDYLYWTDWHTKSIHSCHKSTNKSIKIFSGNLNPMDIHVYNAGRQPPGFTECDENNGGCSHLCLLSSSKSKYSCACPTGVLLLEDKKTCARGPQNILLLARKTDIRLISLDTSDYTDKSLPLKDIKHTIAIDFDPVENYIYWTDDVARAIRRAKLNGSGQENLFTKEISHPDGISVDWISRNLYWTDTGTNRIEVARLNGSSRRVLLAHDLDEPRAIVVDPMNGYMYWSDWRKKARIERSYMDGTNREILINRDLVWPNGLAVDFDEQKLYWGDAYTDKIEMANVDGTDRKVLISNNLPHIFGFSLLGDYVYWTDWQARTIERVHKKRPGDREFIIDHLPDLMGLKAVNVNPIRGTNPCAKANGGCSHLCLTRPGNEYVCACPMNLELATDQSSCIVPEAFLLFSRTKDIRRISLESNHLNKPIPISDMGEVSAIDFDFKDNRIYWSDDRKIRRAYVNGSNVENIVEFGVEFPDSLAVDWISHNIYWIDASFNRIEVASLDGKSRKVVVWHNLQQPKSIAVDPVHGYLYWSDWSTQKIERSALDGSQRYKIIDRISRANGITIDYDEKRLYWVDIDEHTIESCDLAGKRRRKIIYDLSQPCCLTIYQDYVYWVDWYDHVIQRANKSNGADRMQIHTYKDQVSDLLIFHGSRQPGWNECEVHNAGCSHFCFALPSKKSLKKPSYGHSCGCSTHHRLETDNRTCIEPKNFLLFSQREEVSQMLFEDNDSNDLNVILPIHGMHNIKAIDYNPITEYLYWIDDQSKSIQRSHLNGSRSSDVISLRESNFHPYDIAVDPYTNMLYWTCAQTNVINVTRLYDMFPVGAIIKDEEQKPRSIVVDPKRGYIFWINVGKKISIERADLDGSNDITLFDTNLKIPTDLALDIDEGLLFWSGRLNTYLKRIEMSNVDGGNRTVVLKTQDLKADALTIYKSHLYWIDQDTKVLRRVNKIDGRESKTLKRRVAQLSDIVAVESIPNDAVVNHACYSEEKEICSHICLVDRKDGWGRRRCSCPQDLYIGKDGITCGPPPTCELDSFTCSRNGNCIPKSWRCDGNPECKDGSDELNCPDCADETYFKCDNRKCLHPKRICDGTQDCADRSDEACCDDKFQCSSGNVNCIDLEFVCDGISHCDDHSDEIKFMCNSLPKGQMTDIVKTAKEGEGKVSYEHLAVYIFLSVLTMIFCCGAFYFGRKYWYKWRSKPKNRNDTDFEMTPMPNNHPNGHLKSSDRTRMQRNRAQNGDMPDVIDTAGSENIPYDMNRLTGTSCNSVLIQSTPNPPPSPQTMASVRSYYNGNRPPSSHASTLQSSHRKLRERMRGFAPPPTPCSTDLNEDSDFSSDIAPSLKPFYNTLPRREFKSNTMYYNVPSDEDSCVTDVEKKFCNPPPSPTN
ncbi:Low-density lipoprotein receptor-related protein 6 [Nymphon striatum]|nr:Low-density lipoprotein receptor-related protein 6 [Nymphon striatum]